MPVIWPDADHLKRGLEMKKFAAVTAMIMLGSISSAFAQSSDQKIRDASITLYNVCQSAAPGDASTGCACLSGYFGGAMTNRQFEVAGRLSEIGAAAERGATSEVNDLVAAFYAAGYTVEEADEVGAMMSEAFLNRAAAVCSPFDSSNSV